ncbi:hypothetical protein X771_01750 [Mesorhizobium sp. LSJC277A00]|nr:hypothetical protein X771_01750 [Mesorhizobium sp. LSJC277A00]
MPTVWTAREIVVQVDQHKPWKMLSGIVVARKRTEQVWLSLPSIYIANHRARVANNPPEHGLVKVPLYGRVEHRWLNSIAKEAELCGPGRTRLRDQCIGERQTSFHQRASVLQLRYKFHTRSFGLGPQQKHFVQCDAFIAQQIGRVRT